MSLLRFSPRPNSAPTTLACRQCGALLHAVKS